MLRRQGWRDVVCVASGPSFTEDQAALIEGACAAGLCRVVVVNDNYRRLPNADLLYAADGAWWRLHVDPIRCQGFRGELWTQDHAASIKNGLHYIEYLIGDGPLPIDDDRIRCGRNSGLQAIMLARAFGCRRFLLVGYDCSGDNHWFGKHPRPLANGNSTAFVKHFNKAAPGLAEDGISIVNCSPGTHLTCFPRADLATSLAALENEAPIAID